MAFEEVGSNGIQSQMVWHDRAGTPFGVTGYGQGTIDVEGGSTFSVWIVQMFRDGTARVQLAAE